MNGCWILFLLLFCGCNNGIGGCNNGNCGGNNGNCGGRPRGARVMGERDCNCDRDFDRDRRDCDDDRRTFPGISNRNDTCGCEEE